MKHNCFLSPAIRFLCVTLTVLLLTAIFLIGALAAGEARFGRVVPYQTPAILAEVGETVTLTDHSVMFTADKLTAAAEIRWSSHEIAITGGRVSPGAKGVYKLQAEAGTARRDIYLVVKAETDTEWVLYEENFDTVSSFSDLGYNNIETTEGAETYVDNGKLVVASAMAEYSYNRVLLPAWLGDFGDYHLEADVAITSYQVANRWVALMFRVQDTATYAPYYQMAVRAKATMDNGVEVAYGKAKSTEPPKYATEFQVISGVPYTTSFVDGAYHTLRVEAEGEQVRTMIDGNLIAGDAYLTNHDTGMIGFQTRSCVLSVDSIRVTLPQAAANDLTALARIESPASDIILPASAITYVDTIEELASIEAATLTSATAPAVAVLRINEKLQVLTAQNTVILSVSEALNALHGKVIPAFRISSAAAADALCKWLESNGITDAFVLSEDAALIRRVHKAFPYCRGVLDLSNVAPDAYTVAEIREITNESSARICLLPSHLATKDNVELLQRLLMTVWVTSREDSVTELVRLITSGANGIVTESPALLHACYTDYFMPFTMVRSVGIIGHRGSPVYAQENTVEGSVLAAELGATAIENDVYLTKDGVIVVMHDATIDGTTNGSGKVKDFTYAELCRYVVNDNPNVAPKPIPTLEEYLKTFQNKDVQIIVEVKDGNTAICAPLIGLVRKYDMIDQVNVISFHTNILTKLKELAPGLSVGFLISPDLGAKEEIEADPYAALSTILSQVQHYESTYNPKYTTIGPNLIEAAFYRGVAILPWTINSQKDLDTYLLSGAHTLTTDYIQHLSSYVKRVRTEQASYQIAANGTVAIPLSAIAYDDTVTTLQKGTLTVVECSQGLSCSYENGVLTTTGQGTATLLLSASFFTESGTMYSLCTEPFTVTVGGNGAGDAAGDSSNGGALPSPTLTGKVSGWTVASIILSVIAIAASATAITLLVVFRKRERRNADKSDAS